MLSNLEICKKISQIDTPTNKHFDRNGYPLVRDGKTLEWVVFNPFENASQLQALTKKYRVDAEFLGAGVSAIAHMHTDDTVIDGLVVFTGCYEKSILCAILQLFKRPKLKKYKKLHGII